MSNEATSTTTDMTAGPVQRSATHSTFTLERDIAAPVEAVWAAFADTKTKERWFAGPPEWGPEQHEMDFRVGGREVSAGGPPEGPEHRMDGLYWDIVPNERIIMTYEMHLTFPAQDPVRISVSLQTIELEPSATGTRLTLTELGAYLDGYDDSGAREHGTNELIDAMVAVVEGAP